MKAGDGVMMAMEEKNTVEMTVRIDKETKERADELFARLGIDMGTALSIFLCAAVNEGGIPVPVSLKHSDRVTACLPDSIKEAAPLVARYDAEAKKAYLEGSDGSRLDL